MDDVAVTGTLKGYDQLLNLVLDEATENIRGQIFTHSLLTTSYDGFCNVSEPMRIFRSLAVI
jgi:hypothetical protein